FGRAQAAKEAPGSAPYEKDRRGGRVAKPRDSEWRDALEQEDGKRRTEIVEERAHDEKPVRWNPAEGSAVLRDCGCIHRPMLASQTAGVLSDSKADRRIRQSFEGEVASAPSCAHNGDRIDIQSRSGVENAKIRAASRQAQSQAAAHPP